MSFLGIYIILKLSFGVSTRGFLDFLLGGIGDGCVVVVGFVIGVVIVVVLFIVLVFIFLFILAMLP